MWRKTSKAIINYIDKYKITSDGPTNQSKKGTVNAALNSAAHFVGGNNFRNCNNIANSIQYMQ